MKIVLTFLNSEEHLMNKIMAEVRGEPIMEPWAFSHTHKTIISI